jgi:hypothetical protein
MFNVDHVSPSICHGISSSVRKIKPELVGKCMAVALACEGIEAPESRGTRQLLSFLNNARFPTVCCFVAPKIVILTHAIGGILEFIGRGWGKCWESLPLLSSLCPWAWFGLLLWLAVAAATVGSLLLWGPHRVRVSNHRHGCLGSPAHTASLVEDSSLIKKHGKKKVVVRTNSFGQELLQFAHKIARLRPSMPRMSQQFKIGLSLAFAKLSQQNGFEIIERALSHITSVNCV